MIIMNPKFMSLLFTEILIKYLQDTSNAELKNELYDRLNFCGFDKKTIENFIELEKKYYF